VLPQQPVADLSEIGVFDLGVALGCLLAALPDRAQLISIKIPAAVGAFGGGLAITRMRPVRRPIRRPIRRSVGWSIRGPVGWSIRGPVCWAVGGPVRDPVGSVVFGPVGPVACRSIGCLVATDLIIGISGVRNGEGRAGKYKGQCGGSRDHGSRSVTSHRSSWCAPVDGDAATAQDSTGIER
jgi:hypothetical protein